MGLGSVMQTALSGISAAELVVAVAANNSANAWTVGFKASRLTTATQPPQTRSLGAAAAGSNGGSNPIQAGTGGLLAGGLLAGGTELSNVDLGQELKGLSQASSSLSANLAVIEAAGAMLDELTHLVRRD